MSCYYTTIIQEIEEVSSLTGFTPLECRVVFSLSGIYSLRILGLFMMLPVFSLAAHPLEDATPSRIGIAIGIYGLTQALCQIPLGYLSDRLGRKPVIMMGLLLFALGSVVAALSHSIFGVILGRGLQGTGAIGSVIMALLTDLTRSEVRLRAMACVGITIGLSFALAFVLGPLFCSWGGLSSIFWITAFLALLAIGLVNFTIPKTVQLNSTASSSHPPTTLPALYAGVFILHTSLAALFLKVPEALAQFIAADGMWRFYCPILIASLFSAFPILILLEKKSPIKPLLLIILMLGLSELGILTFFDSFIGLSACLWLFFTSFNILEAYLPSLISKQAPSKEKGKALGIFSTLQFLGLFAGGAIGGLLNSWGGLVTVLGFCVILALTWLVSMVFSIDRERLSYGTRLK